MRNRQRQLAQRTASFDSGAGTALSRSFLEETEEDEINYDSDELVEAGDLGALKAAAGSRSAAKRQKRRKLRGPVDDSGEQRIERARAAAVSGDVDVSDMQADNDEFAARIFKGILSFLTELNLSEQVLA